MFVFDRMTGPIISWGDVTGLLSVDTAVVVKEILQPPLPQLPPPHERYAAVEDCPTPVTKVVQASSAKENKGRHV